MVKTIQTAADAAGMTHEVLCALRMMRYACHRTSRHGQRAFGSAAAFKAAIVSAFSHFPHREAVATLVEPLYRSVSRLPELEAESKRRRDRKLQEQEQEDRATAAALAAAQAAASTSTAAAAAMA